MSAFNKILNGQIIALDTVIFVYFLEKNPQYYTLTKDLFYRIERGDISANISNLVFAELLVPAYRYSKKKQAEKIIHLLTSFPNLKISRVSNAISMEAARLRAVYNLRTPDAIHTATALINKADSLITNNKGLKKVSPIIDIIMCD